MFYRFRRIPCHMMKHSCLPLSPPPISSGGWEGFMSLCRTPENVRLGAWATEGIVQGTLRYPYIVVQGTW